ncbi:MAG: hypothetical protein AAGA54_09555 [Myxococcota bacterium]
MRGAGMKRRRVNPSRGAAGSLTIGLALGVACSDGNMPPSADASVGSTTAQTGSSSGSSTSTGAESSSTDGSSSTGAAFEGPGCGIVPTCREELVDRNVGISSLEDLEALAGVTEIGGHLQIASADLVCLDALACLRRVGGEVRILENEQLLSTAGLAAVEEVADDVEDSSGILVSNNAALETLAGFDRLDAKYEHLVVWDNPALKRITAFSSVNEMGEVVIMNNPALESLEGLHRLDELFRCNINRNPTLCISEVFDVCGDAEPVGSGATHGNDEGC